MRKFFSATRSLAISMPVGHGLPESPQGATLKVESNPQVKGATVNREMAYFALMLNLQSSASISPMNPASRVKPFDERRERPTKRISSVWK